MVSLRSRDVSQREAAQRGAELKCKSSAPLYVASRWLTSLDRKPRCTLHMPHYVKTWHHLQKIHNVLHCCQTKTEPRPHLTHREKKSWSLGGCSRSRSLCAVARPSVCRLLSVTLVHSTQAVEIFGNISTAFGNLAILDMRRKFYGDRPKGTPPSGELNPIGVARYSDFGPIEGYI